ncbi:LysR family transcriptional regulator [Sphingobium subterraneum]|uniref:DNA-binding transcriptional LysR family regulator n=1 Tax=Sphingobium subterraneum TaxID=627688 RepID=A0A841J413_9SPHN|nr:LysR family transcriptional regulator [Sphingobium subterraneum]MBB6122991.1 DNA-binding transcriptional LysR family regulator [Sphingobium subterraneum]
MSGWDGIDEFIAVATASSFTRAAKAIGMSPTHVSRSIIALEQRVQAQLFHRTTRTVRLTDTGRVFFERCARIAQERDEAIALIGEQGEPQGELRVTCPTAMGERFIAPIIRRFAMPYPKLNVTIDLSNRVVDLVGEGYDLGIRTGAVGDARLIAARVASRTLYTCAAPSYLERAGTPGAVADLAHHECIAGTSTTWRFSNGSDHQLHRPKGRFRSNSGQAVIEACIAGLGICQLPDFYILPYLKRGMVVNVLEDVRSADEPIWAVYPQRRHLLPKIQRVVECLQHELAAAMRE